MGTNITITIDSFSIHTKTKHMIVHVLLIHIYEPGTC